jgi:hypothetical protein
MKSYAWRKHASNSLAVHKRKVLLTMDSPPSSHHWWWQSSNSVEGVASIGLRPSSANSAPSEREAGGPEEIIQERSRAIAQGGRAQPTTEEKEMEECEHG